MFSADFFKSDLFYCLLAAVLWGISLAVGLFVRRILFPAALRISEKASYRYIGITLEAFQKPVVYIILLCGTLLAISVLPFDFCKTPKFTQLLHVVSNIGFIVLFTWGLWGATRLVPRVIQSVRGRFDLETSKAFANFLTRICQAILFLFAAVMVLSELGYNVNGLIAGLGLGSLTIALAAKDAAANFFGGFTIITERPFEIGDWINASGMEGTVEDITLRSTKIRTLTNALTVVPNAQLCAAPITNWTRMKMRLAQFTVGVTYNTPKSSLEAVLQEMRSMLEKHEGVRSETVQVRLSEFNASSMDIAVQFYTFTTDIMEFRAVREEVLFHIIDILEANHVSFAFPSRTVYLEDTRTQAPQA